jgi:hypothetical protein
MTLLFAMSASSVCLSRFSPFSGDRYLVFPQPGLSTAVMCGLSFRIQLKSFIADL